MKQRGRKSVGDLSAVSFPDARVMPPATLDDDERAEWRAIVDSLPANFFRPGDVPLLAAFCTASALHKQARAEIRAHGMTMENAKGTTVANPACSILTSQASAMAQLSMKLRLCPSSRMVQTDADKQAGDGAKGARPWDEQDKPQSLAS